VYVCVCVGSECVGVCLIGIAGCDRTVSWPSWGWLLTSYATPRHFTSILPVSTPPPPPPRTVPPHRLLPVSLLLLLLVVCDCLPVCLLVFLCYFGRVFSSFKVYFHLLNKLDTRQIFTRPAAPLATGVTKTSSVNIGCHSNVPGWSKDWMTRSSTNPDNLAKMGLVDFEIIGMRWIVKK